MTTLGMSAWEGGALLAPLRRPPVLACAALLALLLGAGCGGNSGTMAPPTITLQPASQEVQDGAPATFTVAASGADLRYQWSCNGSPVGGATSSTCALPAVAYRKDHGATFTVAVINGAGQVTSAPAKLTVRPLPTTLAGLASQTMADGSTATLRVTATGTGPFTYQWRRGGKDLPGATSETLTLSPVVYATDHQTPFTVAVTNAAGTTTHSGEALLTVTPLPTQLSGLGDLTVPDGTAAVLRVQAAGTGPFSYQWRRNDIEIPGAQGAILQTGTLSYAADHRSRYAVIVTNGAGQKTISSPATLSIQPRGLSLAPLADQTVLSGDPVTFQVTTSGTGPFTYQWLRNSSPIPGANSASYTLQSTTYLADRGARFSVVVTDGAGQITSSNAALLTIQERPTVITGPTDATVPDGGDLTLSAVAAGTPPYRFQWLRNGVAIPDATSATYTRAGLVYIQDHGSTYAVAVTNAAGTVTQSRTATVQVTPKPTLLSGPEATTATEGRTTTFSVTPSGTPPWGYQWLRNGAPIPGAQSSIYTTPSLVYPGDAGAMFSVRVTNGAQQTVTSPEVALTLQTDLQITTQPEDQTVTAPDSPTFRVIATGTRALSYQWMNGTSTITDAKDATFTLGDFTDLKTVPGTYTVRVSDGVRSVDSRAVTFRVMAPKPYYPAAGHPQPSPARPLTVKPSFYTHEQFPDGAFMLGYDEALKNPAWTAYADFKIHSATNTSGNSYTTDTRMQAPQVTGDDMGTHGGQGFFLSGGKGFDRGHMCMQSDVTYRYGADAGTSTNRMSNLIPQVSYMNQRIWLNLEQTVGGTGSGTSFNNGLSARFGRIWIYSGPVFPSVKDYWVPSTEVYTRTPETLPAGTLTIAIPTACYKVVLAEPTEGQQLPRVMAWLGSNRPYESAESADLWKYTTSVQRIEELTGLDLFPNLKTLPGYDTWRTSVDVRGWGPAFEKATGPNVHIVKPSWDVKPFAGNPVLKGETVTVGTPVDFEGFATVNATTPAATIASASWTFGDGQSASTASARHSFASASTYTATFTATDSLGASNTITRVITVVDPAGNMAPTITGLTHVVARLGAPAPLSTTFTVGDDTTPAGSIGVTVTSSNQAVLQDSNIEVLNTGGSVRLNLTPEVGAIGTTTLTVSAFDGLATSTGTLTFTVAANTAPVITPAQTNLTTTPGTAKTTTFTVTDDDTITLPTVTVTSGLESVLPNDASAIQLARSGNTYTLTLTPLPGQLGTVPLTVTAQDSDGVVSTANLTLDVKADTSPQLIISQYYEGTGTNKWIEVTNIGTTDYDNSDTANKRYLCTWSNPNSGTTINSILIPSIPAGATILFKNSTTVPGPTISAVPVTNNTSVISFNGNDPVYITTQSGTATTTWDFRVDAVGTKAWGAANPAADKSYVRKLGAIPTKDHVDAQWDIILLADLAAQVDSAPDNVSRRLGFHIK